MTRKYRGQLLILLLTLSSAVMSCAENPHLEIYPIDQASASIQFNVGPFIKKIDPDKALKDYCGSLKPKIIHGRENQLPGQYRFQKRIEFTCVTQ